MKRCFSCKRGEINFTEKDGPLYKADVRDPETGKLEGKGWLCDDHLQMYRMDGFRVKVQEKKAFIFKCGRCGMGHTSRSIRDMHETTCQN